MRRGIFAVLILWAALFAVIVLGKWLAASPTHFIYFMGGSVIIGFLVGSWMVYDLFED